MGERDLTAAIKAELSKDQVQIALFVEMIFDSGALRLWSGIGDRILNGNTFNGAGQFGKIDRIEESAGDIKAAGITLSLSGIPANLRALAEDEDCQGRPVNVWLGFFDSDWTLIANAVKLNGYLMDYPIIEEGGSTCTITVFCESILADLERPKVRRYTHEDQQDLYPGDM
jgi:hypothetical protein